MKGIIGKKGKLNGEFNYPNGICVDDNNIYVSDFKNHRIQIFDKNNYNFIRIIGKKGNQFKQFHHPNAISVDNYNIYICDSSNNRIQIIDKSQI